MKSSPSLYLKHVIKEQFPHIEESQHVGDEYSNYHRSTGVFST
jgi:hypothetical protein